jgi:mannose-1-phosphate guanylyltransferase
MKHTYAVIMAGGGGTRLWPVSRQKHPKHILPLLGERTLFQDTLERLEGFISSDQVYAVTTEDQKSELQAQAQKIPDENFLIEPLQRGTASVVGLAAAILAKRDPEAVMIVMPADHFLKNSQLFQDILRVAVDVARNDYLVTLGIPPTHPSTGYGYIQWDGLLPKKFKFPVHKVIRFTEKPDKERARAMVAEGDYAWNSGIFIWQVISIMDEFSIQMPQLFDTLKQIGEAWGTNRQQEVLRLLWKKLIPETIDYGIMEHAAKVAVIPAGGLDWSDVGSWDSLFEVLPQDGSGNVSVNCDHLQLNTKNSMIYSTGKKLIATIGVEELIIIETGDALLVCRRDQAQQVRQVIERLKELHREDCL